jgi:hypothetical protein
MDTRRYGYRVTRRRRVAGHSCFPRRLGCSQRTPGTGRTDHRKVATARRTAWLQPGLVSAQCVLRKGPVAPDRFLRSPTRCDMRAGMAGGNRTAVPSHDVRELDKCVRARGNVDTVRDTTFWNFTNLSGMTSPFNCDSSSSITCDLERTHHASRPGGAVHCTSGHVVPCLERGVMSYVSCCMLGGVRYMARDVAYWHVLNCLCCRCRRGRVETHSHGIDKELYSLGSLAYTTKTARRRACSQWMDDKPARETD